MIDLQTRRSSKINLVIVNYDFTLSADAETDKLNFKRRTHPEPSQQMIYTNAQSIHHAQPDIYYISGDAQTYKI